MDEPTWRCRQNCSASCLEMLNVGQAPSWSLSRLKMEIWLTSRDYISRLSFQPLFLGVNLLSREGYSQAGDRMMTDVKTSLFLIFRHPIHSLSCRLKPDGGFLTCETNADKITSQVLISSLTAGLLSQLMNEFLAGKNLFITNHGQS